MSLLPPISGGIIERRQMVGRVVIDPSDIQKLDCRGPESLTWNRDLCRAVECFRCLQLRKMAVPSSLICSANRFRSSAQGRSSCPRGRGRRSRERNVEPAFPQFGESRHVGQ